MFCIAESMQIYIQDIWQNVSLFHDSSFRHLRIAPGFPFLDGVGIAVDQAGLGVEGDVDFAEILKMAEHSDDCRPVALRNTLEVVGLLHHRKSVDPVRIGLFLLADEGGVPSAEVLDLLICVKKIWSVVRHSFQIDTSCQKSEFVKERVLVQCQVKVNRFILLDFFREIRDCA